MPLDPNIAMGYQQPKIADPMSQYANVLAIQNAQQQNQLGGLQYQNALRAQREEEATRQAISGAGGDYDRAVNALLSKGLYKPAGAISKQQAELAKSKIDLDKAKADTYAKNLEIYGNSMATLLANPSPDNVGSVLENLKAQGIPFHAPVPTVLNQDALMQWVRSGASASAHGLNAIQAYSPDVVMTDLGGTVQPVNKNMMAGPIGALPNVPALEKTPTIPTGMVRDASGKLVFDPNYIAGRVQIANAGKNTTNVNMPAQEKAFEVELGKEQAKEIVTGRKGAEDAKEIINTVNVGKQLLKSGIVSGFGAEYITNFGKALNQAGISLGNDTISNTEAFAANMAQNVGKVIKQFGAGTGLSNADREYAEKMAGGKITLNKDSIEKILNLNDRAARNIIKSHNNKAKGVKSNIPLTVDEPPAYSGSSIQDQADAILKGGG